MHNNIEDTVSSGSGSSISISQESAPAGWGVLLGGKNGVYALTLAGGVTLHALNMYIATTVMPSVVVDIGGLNFYAWTTTLFVMASILVRFCNSPC
ncbi:MAG: hypothetical protein ACRECW_13965 [Phyllobacterium sp.]